MKKSEFIFQICSIAVYILLAFLSLTGCLIIPGNTTSESAVTSISSTTELTLSSSTPFEPTSSTTYSPTTELPKPTYPDAAFDSHINSMIMNGLINQEQEINLDEVFKKYRFDEDLIPIVIDHIYVNYQIIYQLHPEFFYLNGAFQTSYTLSENFPHYIKSMRIIPEFWPSTAALNKSDLNNFITVVEAEAESWANEIKETTQEPWEQLTLLHDLLVDRVVYSYEYENNAISALLDHATVCQGYSQAFQLVGTKLGFKIMMINGTVSGIPHVWNIVWLNNIPYHVDVTFDDVLFRQISQGNICHRYLFRSDLSLADDRQWDTSIYPNYLIYPECPDDGLFYYKYNNLITQDNVQLWSQLERFVSLIDFQSKDWYYFETLYSGQNMPSQIDLEKMMDDLLQKVQTGADFYFGFDNHASIISLDVNPNPG